MITAAECPTCGGQMFPTGDSDGQDFRCEACGQSIARDIVNADGLATEWERQLDERR